MRISVQCAAISLSMLSQRRLIAGEQYIKSSLTSRSSARGLPAYHELDQLSIPIAEDLDLDRRGNNVRSIERP